MCGVARGHWRGVAATPSRKTKRVQSPPPSFGCWMADSWPAFSISILGVAIPAVGGAFGAGKAVEWNGKWSGVEWNWGDTKT